MRHTLLKTLSLLWLPVAETYFLRWLFHHPAIDLRPGFQVIVDADLILPGLCAASLFVLLLEREKPLRLVWDKRWAAINVLFFFSFLGWSLAYRQFAAQPLWWCLWNLMVISALFTRLPPQKLFSYRIWPIVFPCHFIASSLFWIKYVYRGAWSTFGTLSAEATCSILTYLTPPTQCLWVKENRLAIIHPEIHILMGAPCSGIDALFLFLVTTGIYLIVTQKRPTPWSATALLATSGAFAFGLNILRVVSIFVLSLVANAVWGSKTVGIQIFVSLFHSHAGWVIYSLGSILFFSQLAYVREAWSVRAIYDWLFLHYSAAREIGGKQSKQR